MRALDRKLLRDLRRIWAQSLAIALVLACGIMVLVMADGTLRSLSETRAAYYDRHRFADVFAGVTRAPRSLLDQVAAIDGVAQAEARIVLPAVLDLDGMAEPATARVLSLPASGTPALNLPLLRAGRMPDPLREAEVLVNEPFAEKNALHPGDRFRITLKGQRRDLVVAGVILSPEFIYTIGPGTIMPDDRHFGLIWMNEAPLAAAADLDGAFNDLTLGLARGASEAAVIAALDRLLAPYGGTGAQGRDRQVSHVFLNSEFQQLTTISVTIPPVFLIVSAFLVNMVLGRLIALERSQIGLLKALGYGTGQIAGHYLKMSVGIGIGGVAMGLAAGWRAGQWMTGLYAEYFRFPWLIYDPGPRALTLSAALGMAAVVLGALRAVWSSARLAPAVAMSPPAPPTFHRGWVDGVGRLLALRQSSMMILRSVTRWPGRAAVTFFGVAASVAVLVGCFFMFDAMDLMMDELFVQANRQDVTLILADARNDIAVTDAQGLPGVRLAEGGFALPVRLSFGATSRLTTLQARADGAELTRLLDPEGHAIALPGDGLVLPERLAGRLGVQPGDRVQVELLVPPRETWQVEVTGLIRQSLGEEVHMARAAVFRRMRQPPQVNMIHLSVDPAALPALNARVKATPAIAGLTSWTDVEAEVEASTDRSMKSVTLIFSALGVLIALGVVYNAARIQLAERAHELASLRVLGFSRAEVGFVLVGEMMLLALLAIPAGWGLGYGFAALVHQGFSTDVVSLPFQITRRTYGLAALMVGVAALVAALWVRRGLDRVDLVQALKQRE
ncbi:FtsX-like permease family protein [Rhodobacter sp. Har01]|uniref:ABC transporter permease n=1 Tax=Rhodobacter sp. Har01 TaxID=2883999 RepID=UPI001D091501|nr:FtsX-like permease family protein [Rhodobacter sp. Har01]MCB6176735.1 FtsX-like permease family protein [Rhodobacter sp. Har01]